MRESTAPVDRTARESAASAIEDFLDAKIDNDELERAIFAPQVQADATCREIALELSLYYSDFAQHKNQGKYRIPDEMERTIRRWVLLLRSDWQWPPGRKDSTPCGRWNALLAFFRANFCVRSRVAKNEYWPLDTELSWTQLKGSSRGRGNSVENDKLHA